MDLSVIIVNYRVKYFTEYCLRSVLAASRGLEAHLIVVDNHSGDGSLEYLEPLFPEVHFIRNDQNLGFGAANNQAARLVEEGPLLLLNPDTMIGEDCLERCIRFLKDHPDTGSLGVRMIDGRGRFLRESKRGFPSPMVSFYRMTGMTRLFPRSAKFSHYYLGQLPENQTNPAEVVAGAFCLIPRKAWQQVGGFDEDFFLYGEDIDLSYRLSRAGYHNYYLGDLSILHFKGVSSGQETRQYLRMFHQAMKIFVRKHFRKGRTLFSYAAIQSAISLRSAIAQASGRLFFMRKKDRSFTRSGAPYILVGYAEDCFEAARALPGPAAPDDILGIVFPGWDQDPPEGYLGTFQGIPALAKKHRGCRFILCQGKFRFGEIIRLIDSKNRPPRFLVHASGSSAFLEP
ncbi:MAG TPA: glycosyltransferase family 2 protein [Chitinophagaceae bacterium]|nr:glycosyltransferase family 2 protein [Chitinophagaceae bacterium]